MSMIIPYDKHIEKVDAAYITPDGNIEYTFSHEQYARDYCLGPNYDQYKSIKEGKLGTVTDEEYLLEELMDIYHYPDTISSISDINEYIGTKLSKEEFDLLKKYEHSRFFFYTYSEFMVSILHYDKAQDLCGRRIITSSNIPHIRFYNYYLMDWKIEKVPKIYWNSNFNCLEEEKYQRFGMDDAKYEAELKDIKRKILRPDREVFFRK